MTVKDQQPLNFVQVTVGAKMQAEASYETKWGKACN
jgi:hypothetical protein